MAIDHEQLVKLVDKIPAFPQSVNKIIELTSRADVLPKDLVSVIEMDPILTVRVLKLVNSAFFGLSREVTSVQHAVVYVGINTIKNVAISVAMVGALPKSNKAGLNMDAFWKQSLTIGVIAKLLAERTGVPSNDSGDYFVTGLLHNIGKIIFAHFYPDEYREVLEKVVSDERAAYLVEQELLGIDHSELGGMLAEDWQLPADLLNGIRNHHNAEQKVTESRLPLAIFSASQIYHLVNGNQHERIEIPDSIEKWLGATLEGVVESFTNLDEEVEKAMVFIN